MSDTAEWTEERVRRLLVHARPYGSQGAVLGAKLGALLRKFDPEFHSNVLGDKNLKALVARFPDVGTLHDYEKSLDFVFRFGDHGVSSSAETSSPTYRSLDPDLWVALVSGRSREMKYLDLHSLEITSVSISDTSADPSPVSQEPERYLLIQPVPQEELRTLARSFIESTPAFASDKELLALTVGEDWFHRFTAAVTEAGHRRRWLAVHRDFVINTAIVWLRNHDIDPKRFVRTARGRRGASDERQPPPSSERLSPASPLQPDISIDRQNVRSLVLRAIGRMSDDELLSLPIPIRYLIS